MSRQTIYLLRIGPHAIYNEATFKVGKTTREMDIRLSEYPKGSHIMRNYDVENCHKLEKLIMADFDLCFVKRRDLGLEYYTGNPYLMMDIMHDHIDREIKMSLALRERPGIVRNIEMIIARHANAHILDSEILNTDKYLDDLQFSHSSEDEIDVTPIKIATVDLSKDNIDDIDNIDTAPVSDTQQNFINIEERSIGSNESEEEKDDVYMLRFCRHIYNTTPSWYKPEEYVSLSIIAKELLESVPESPREITSLHKDLAMLFTGSKITSRGMSKKLISYEKLGTFLQTISDKKHELRMSSFYEHLHNTKPFWYNEKEWVNFSHVENEYRKFFNYPETNATTISKNLSKMFRETKRSNGLTLKKLVSFVKLKKLF